MPNAMDNPIVRALQEYTTYVTARPGIRVYQGAHTQRDASCDVSDALCKLKFRNGVFLSGLTMWSPCRQEGDTKVVGPAYTVQYVPLDDPSPKHPTHYV